MSDPSAVILSYHGSVADLDDMPAFLQNIRRGRPVPDDLLKEVLHRYRLIGGSPLIEVSRAQAALLEARLGVPVRSAGRLWHPYPSEVLPELVRLGARRIVSLPLAPQSVDVYHQAVREVVAAMPEPRPALACAPAWGLEPRLIDAFVETVDEGLAKLAPASASEVGVLLTAHSLPLRVIRSGDRYEAEFREMAAAVAEVLSRRGHRVEVAFQSQGASQEPWLGPDLPTAFAGFVKRGIDSVLVAPVGFLAEHVETLYDLDVEAAATASAAGVRRYARAPAVGTHPTLIDALEAVARRALGEWDKLNHRNRHLL